MDVLNDLKKMLEGQSTKKEDPQLEREKKFIRDAASCLNPNADQSALMNYDPAKMLAFLRTPVRELKKRLGGEWEQMDDASLRAFLYDIEKKIEKSTSLLDWENRCREFPERTIILFSKSRQLRICVFALADAIACCCLFAHDSIWRLNFLEAYLHPVSVQILPTHAKGACVLQHSLCQDICVLWFT